MKVLNLANKLLELGSKRKIYDFYKNEGAYVQSYSSFVKNYSEVFYDSYREDLVYKYIPDENEQNRIIELLK